jgi:hypothetical protein
MQQSLRGKALLHNLSVFVPLGTQQAVRMRHIVPCGLPGSTFVHMIAKAARFSEGKNY